MIVTNTINNILARHSSHGASGGAAKPSAPAAASSPVTINNIASGAANGSLGTTPTADHYLTIDAREVALGAGIAFVMAAAFFFFGWLSAHAREKAHPGKAGEWLDLGSPGAFGFTALDIEARVRGSGATWSWQRISRQKLIDHLNATPSVRDTLLETAPAHPSAAEHVGHISTVVNQTAH